MFLNIVSETIDNGGTVVIPSFAVGRTQEILYELNKIKENTDDAEFMRTYDTSLIIVPTNESLKDEPGSLEISSDTLKNWINNNTAYVAD